MESSNVKALKPNGFRNVSYPQVQVIGVPSLPRVHFIPAEPGKSGIPGGDAKTANAARTRAAPTSELTVDLFFLFIFIPPARTFHS